MPAAFLPSDLVHYIDKVHVRTQRLVPLIPPDDLEWSPAPDWFSFGGLLRHLAGIERWLYAENAQGRASCYPGHGRELADGYDAVIAYYDRLHEEAMAVFRKLDEPMLARKVLTPADVRITLWKWLRAMTEHEAHHRGQLYLMLTIRGIKSPPLYGLTAEEVQITSTGG